MTPKDLERGRLSQTCPACGITEAAGHYCSRCHRAMGPADWKAQERRQPGDEPETQPEPERAAPTFRGPDPAAFAASAGVQAQLFA